MTSYESDKRIMSMQFTCDDKQTLVAYLYGEIDPADAQGGRRSPRDVRGVRGRSDGARRRALGARAVGAARCGARLHDRQEVRRCRRRTCCGPRAGGTPCRCGRRPPPRSSCSPPAPRSPTCRSSRDPMASSSAPAGCSRPQSPRGVRRRRLDEAVEAGAGRARTAVAQRDSRRPREQATPRRGSRAGRRRDRAPRASS